MEPKTIEEKKRLLRIEEVNEFKNAVIAFQIKLDNHIDVFEKDEVTSKGVKSRGLQNCENANSAITEMMQEFGRCGF